MSEEYRHTKTKKPRLIRMPESGARAVYVGRDSQGRFVQLVSSGTYEAKTVRRIAAYLLKAARWMEGK